MINEFLNLPWAKIFLLFLFFYLFVLIVAWIYADRALFPFPISPSYENSEVDFFVTTQSGLKIACMSKEPVLANGHIVIFSHGNGEDLGMIQESLIELTKTGCTVISYDYPGYGLSEGIPTENNCYEAVEALYNFVSQDMSVAPNKIILWGRSLGTGPSCYLASLKKVGGLILETPFLSAFRTVTEITIIPWDRFRNIEFVQAIRCPSLVIHGELDEVVPYRQGRKIFNELPEPKTFLEVENGTHNDLKEKGGKLYEESIKKFFDSLTSN